LLGKRGFGVQIFNAYTTFQERASALHWCKTDDLDLIALAYAIKKNKGTEFTLDKGIQRQLLILTRARRQEIRKRSALQMEIHVLMTIFGESFKDMPLKKSKPEKRSKYLVTLGGSLPCSL
jgi:transposase